VFSYVYIGVERHFRSTFGTQFDGAFDETFPETTLRKPPEGLSSQPFSGYLVVDRTVSELDGAL
jgi:hypothetical protein